MIDREKIREVLAHVHKGLKAESYFFKARYLLPIIAIAMLYQLLDSFRGAVFIGILAIIASYSTIYKRVIRIPSAIETVTIGTAVTAINYGPLAGALFGAITTLASEIISGGIDMFTFVYMFARAVLGVAAFFLAGINTVMLGLIMTLAFNAICQPIYQLPGDIETRIKGVYFLIISVISNLILFFVFGDFLIGLAA